MEEVCEKYGIEVKDSMYCLNDIAGNIVKSIGIPSSLKVKDLLKSVLNFNQCRSRVTFKLKVHLCRMALNFKC